MGKFKLNKTGTEINTILEYAVLTNNNQEINALKIFKQGLTIRGKGTQSGYLNFEATATNYISPLLWAMCDGTIITVKAKNVGTVPSGTGGSTLEVSLGSNSEAPGATLLFPHKSGTLSLAGNLENGSNTGSVQEIQDGTGGTFSFTGKNPNATALDSSLTGNIAYGGVGQYSSSFGGKSQASGKRSLAQGTTTVAKGSYSHAEGDNSVSLGSDSHAEGYKTVSYGTASHSEGNNTQALGNDSHAEGTNTISNAQNSHAEGYESETRTSSSERPTIPTYGQAGSGSTGGGSGSGSGGSSSQTGDGAHAEGVQTRACGNASHTEGISTWATAYGSHAEGYGCQAIKDYAHAEGYNCLASGFGAHATGVHTEAVGNYSFTQGRETKALKDLSSAFGKGTKANGEQQMVVGRYNNYTITDAYFMVGMGVDDDHRRNALAVMTDGTLAIPNFNSNGDIIGTKRIKCVNGVLTVID